jgi:hypothetical protein
VGVEAGGGDEPLAVAPHPTPSPTRGEGMYEKEVGRA